MNTLQIITAVNNLKTTKWRHLVQVFDYAVRTDQKGINTLWSNKLESFERKQMVNLFVHFGSH